MAPQKAKKDKPRAFLIFADLDGTFTPMDIPGKLDFVHMVREISEKGDVQVKFIPISGRPPGYVLRVLHDTRDICKQKGLENICDYGAAEQGAVIVDSSRSYFLEYTGDKSLIGVKKKIGDIMSKNEHADILCDENDKLFTCSLHILKEVKEKMTPDEQLKVLQSLRNDIEKQIDQKIDISMSHNSMEIMTPDISKPNSVDILLWRYMKNYDVVGMMFAGDAGNDKHAIEYMSKQMEIPGGLRANVFEPANAQEAVASHTLEAWKDKNPAASKNRIQKGEKSLFRGVTGLIRESLANGTLLGPGIHMTQTLDDSAIHRRKEHVCDCCRRYYKDNCT